MPWKPEEDVGPPGAEVNCNCDPSDMGLGAAGPLQEQYMLLFPEHPFSPHGTFPNDLCL